MNEITIHGNLTADPVLREGQSGKSFLTFTVVWLPSVCGGKPECGGRHPGAPGSRAGHPGRRRPSPGRRAGDPARRRQDRANSGATGEPRQEQISSAAYGPRK